MLISYIKIWIRDRVSIKIRGRIRFRFSSASVPKIKLQHVKCDLHQPPTGPQINKVFKMDWSYQANSHG